MDVYIYNRQIVNCPPPATTKAYCTNTTALLLLTQFATSGPRLQSLSQAQASCKAQCSDVKGKHVQPDDQRRSRRSARRSARFVAKGLMDSGRRGTKAPAETGSDGLEEFEDRPPS